MWPELINLLPTEYQRTLRRLYTMRLAVLAIILIAVVLIVNGIFLIPTYLYEKRAVEVEKQTLVRISSNPSVEEKQVNQRLATLSQQATVLANLSGAPTASNSVKAVLAVARPGIKLTNFVYVAPTKTAPGTMQVSGVADTRENLRSFNTALSALPFVSNVNLPIEAYAKATNLPFTITLTGTFAP